MGLGNFGGAHNRIVVWFSNVNAVANLFKLTRWSKVCYMVVDRLLACKFSGWNDPHFMLTFVLFITSQYVWNVWFRIK